MDHDRKRKGIIHWPGEIALEDVHRILEEELGRQRADMLLSRMGKKIVRQKRGHNESKEAEHPNRV